jgi:hypothetical protein
MKNRFSVLTLLAIVTLLGGSACSGPCDQFCDKMEECSKGKFDSEFSDNDECVKECEDELDKVKAEECTDAIDAAASCYSDLECKDIEERDFDACESEFKDVGDKCDEEKDLNLIGIGAAGGGGNNENNNGAGAATCPFTNDGECDEPEGTGNCAEGTDVADCG